jgi:hypothetical protein
MERVTWRFSWRTSRLVRWCATAAGAAGGGLVGAAVLARFGAPLASGALLAPLAIGAAVYSTRLAAAGRARGAFVARVLATVVPAALLLYALALRGRLVAVAAVVGALQVALAAGTFATALRTSGTVDPDRGTLSYGTERSQVTVRLDRARGAYAVRFRHRALLLLTYRDGGLLDPAAPSLVVVSRDAADAVRRIVRS